MEVQVISNTVQKFNGESFYLCGEYFQHKGKRLHRTVWEYHNGDIPKGYHVHHKDGDKTNNDPANLELMSGTDHLRGHMAQEERKEAARQSVKKAIEAAPEWHRSTEGREWHSKHSKETWACKDAIKYTCTYCGKEFYTRKSYGDNARKYCSNNCRSAHRRARGVDNEKRICSVCGKTFSVNRYSITKTCSYECARVRRWGNEG